ncbi:MAG: 50S ribosomal protein L20 [Candidatus Omnitrophica bacterium]|nr:50S ribosomal protein L20 [Candidatus Omnitrophota bacterium]
MARVRHAVSTHKRKKRVLKQTKGQFAQKSTRYRQAKRSLIKGLAYAFRDRKVKKRQFRQLWIVRINAACQEAGITYSRFMKGVKQAKIGVDRKMIAELAVSSPDAFQKLVEMAKKAA